MSHGSLSDPSTQSPDAVRGAAEPEPEEVSVVIVGSGFSGLGMAVRLKQSGVHSFVILERAPDVGGTWRDNTYPGCACDVQSHLYSFSFEPNPGWSRMFAPQAEIQRYLQHCVKKYALREQLRLGDGVLRSDYDEASGTWSVRTASGKRYRAQSLVHATGAFGKAAYPSVPGIERFQGKRFHSAHWDHDYPLDGKRVAVIGTGASAIQFVPAIQPQVKKLTLFQRTAPWVLSKPDRPITELERGLFRVSPFFQRAFRAFIYFMLELRVLGFLSPKLMTQFEKIALAHLDKQVKDPTLRQKLTPTFTIGCKRILMSDTYYPSLTQPNSEVVTEEITEVREHCVVTKDGREHEVDAIIFGTGFAMGEIMPRGLVFGRGGRDIADWEQGVPEAFKGTSFTGVPNFYMLLGPNTALGHSSVIHMIESQIAYVVQAILRMGRERWKSLEVRPEVLRRYNDALASKHKGAVWLSGCKSWYLDAKGRNFTLWPGFTFTFRKALSRFEPKNYIVTHTEQKHEPAQASAAVLTAGSVS